MVNLAGGTRGMRKRVSALVLKIDEKQNAYMSRTPLILLRCYGISVCESDKNDIVFIILNNFIFLTYTEVP